MTTEKPARGLTSLFDLRWILAVLFGIYGIVVTLMGLLVSNKTVTANGQDVGVNVNLWTWVPMLAVAIGFAAWALARPVVPDEVSPRSAEGQAGGSADGTASPG